MADRTHKQTQRTPTPAQQQLILRALVGSLVFCAALAAPARAQVAQPESKSAPREAETEHFPVVNTLPFKELLAKALRLRADGSLGSEETFDFTVEADRMEDGRLHNVTVVGGASDARGAWRGLTMDFVAAVSDSRLLAAFKDALHVSMRLRLDAQTSLASLSFEAPSESHARQLARGYDALLHMASLQQRGANSAAVLNSLKVSASGKQFAVKLEMSREQLGNLLRQSLSLP
ncbi:MAG: hypothetical protein LC785_14245 [Acidobacteria bacterium]|nr:hypothetical protein [Acidobacteriota bacterium]MCA1643074.1 hypothetical protein [Acidobacteriota bacterium]